MMLRCLAILLVLGGCVQEHDVALVLQAEGDTTEVVRYTIRIYQDGCPTREEMATNQDRRFNFIYDVSGSERPVVGELAPGTYSFAALGRNAACAPVVFGCVPADIEQTERVVVPLRPLTWSGTPGSECPAGVGCTDGICGGPVMMRPCGEGGPCPMCGDTSRDAFNCGRCAHSCPNELSCVDSLCRPQPIPDDIALYLSVGPGGVGSDTTPLVAGIAWMVPNVGGGGAETGAPMAVAVTPISPPSPTGELLIRLSEVEVPSGAIGVLAASELAFGQIVVRDDPRGDGLFEFWDLFAPDNIPLVYGVSEVALIWSPSDAPPDPSAAYLPEGRMNGLRPYARIGRTLIPDGAIESYALPTCRDDVSRIEACISGLPSPFRGLQ